MDLQTLGKFLLVFAAALAVTGVLLIVGARLGFGSLPGDLRASGEGWGCYVPIATSILLSLILTVVLNLILRWFR